MKFEGKTKLLVLLMIGMLLPSTAYCHQFAQFVQEKTENYLRVLIAPTLRHPEDLVINTHYYRTDSLRNPDECDCPQLYAAIHAREDDINLVLNDADHNFSTALTTLIDTYVRKLTFEYPPCKSIPLFKFALWQGPQQNQPIPEVLGPKYREGLENYLRNLIAPSAFNPDSISTSVKFSCAQNTTEFGCEFVNGWLDGSDNDRRLMSAPMYLSALEIMFHYVVFRIGDQLSHGKKVINYPSPHLELVHHEM